MLAVIRMGSVWVWRRCDAIESDDYFSIDSINPTLNLVEIVLPTELIINNGRFTKNPANEIELESLQ